MEFLASASFLTATTSRQPVRALDAAAVPHASALAEEALVADPRAALTPAQMVERKLASLLKSHPLPVSHVRTTRQTSRGR